VALFGDAGRSLIGDGAAAVGPGGGVEEGVVRGVSGESEEPTPEEMPQSDFVEGDVAKEEEEEAEECGGYVDFGMSPRRVFSFRG
jgi:hypothetical protein